MKMIQSLFIVALMVVQGVGATGPKPVPLETNMAGEGVPSRVEAEMVRLYEAAADDINRIAAKAFGQLAESPDLASANYRAARAAEMERAIIDRLARLERIMPTIIDSATREAVERAIKFGERELADLGLDPANARPGTAASIGFGVIDDGAVRRIAEDTSARAINDMTENLRQGARDHGRNALRTFRSLSSSTANIAGGGEAAVNRAIARGLITGDPTIADRAIRDLYRDPKAPERESVRKLGNKQIQVGNAVMSVRQYAATVVRTRTREATVSARHDRLGASGINLVQIVGRNSANFCTAFIGLVCSLGGEQTIGGTTYPALSSLPSGGPPFHPNCSKSTAAFVPELVSAGRIKLNDRAAVVYRQRLATGRLTAPVKSK